MNLQLWQLSLQEVYIPRSLAAVLWKNVTHTKTVHQYQTRDLNRSSKLHPSTNILLDIMKSFTPLLCFAATLLAVLPQTMAAPKAESPAFPDSLCGVAIEFDIPVGSIDKRQMVGPPDYWCCDVCT